MSSRKANHQSGFTVIEILLVVVIAVAVITVGWLVYHRVNKKDNVSELKTQQDVIQQESELKQKDESLDKELGNENEKLDKVTEEVQ